MPNPAEAIFERVRRFATLLIDAGIVTTTRKTRGDDIDAACGQLAGDVKDRTSVGQRMAAQRAEPTHVPLKFVPLDKRQTDWSMKS